MPLLEVVCCSVEDCVAAQAAGADRIELCSAIELGGITPSLGLFRAAKAQVTLPIFVMIRLRAGGFQYEPSEVEAMREDAAIFKSEGTDGFVLGALDESGRVDRQTCATLVEACGGLPVTFHRAFDATPDPYQALDDLIEVGITRAMTSGQTGSAILGAPLLKELMGRGAGRIGILPGGGIRPDNVQELVAKTGCTEVHIGPFVPSDEPGYEDHRAVRLDHEQVRQIKSLIRD
jgi:copper homeostasis protein